MFKYNWIFIGMVICLTGCSLVNNEPMEKISLEATITDTSIQESTNEESATVNSSEKRQLSLTELKEFETLFNGVELISEGKYAFLLSYYDTPDLIDLDALLYNGIGQMNQPLTEAEQQAFLQAIGESELMTDQFRLSTAEIDEYLMDHLGINFKDVKTDFNWVYLSEYDSYYSEHGDTNATPFVCLAGSVDQDIYQIFCSAVAESTVSDCLVTLKKTEQGYQFLSNQPVALVPNVVQTIWTDAADLKMAIYLYHKERSKHIFAYQEPIFDSYERVYSSAELADFSPDLRAIFRNEIYARHGYLFEHEKWNDFFGQYQWYQGRYPKQEFSPERFNEFEKTNLELATQSVN